MLSRYRRDGCPISELTTAAEVQAWRQSHKLARKGVVLDAGDSLQERYIKSQIAKNEAEAEAKRLRNAKTKSELYDATEVERCVAELTSMIRCRLEAIPNELQTEWPLELRSLVTQRMADKIHAILTEMSSWRLPAEATGPGIQEPEAHEAEAVESE
jgi:phage terminase Nu1 subunit (DNA packaging protein)